MKVPQVVLKAKDRAEQFLKTFEWTWTTAVVFSLGFGFFSVITMAVIPSFWLYFSEQTLGLGRPVGDRRLATAGPRRGGDGPRDRPVHHRRDRRGDHAELAAQAARRLGRARLGRLPMRKV